MKLKKSETLRQSVLKKVYPPNPDSSEAGGHLKGGWFDWQ